MDLNILQIIYSVKCNVLRYCFDFQKIIKYSSICRIYFVTEVYVKSTNIHQYVEYSSCHPKSCKDGIPFSQCKRYRRIISDDAKFSESVSQ